MTTPIPSPLDALTSGGTGYVPPGVYITQDTAPLLVSNGVPTTLVALVGPSAGFQSNAEQILLSDIAGTQLTKKGIDQNSIVVSRVDNSAELTTAEYSLTTSGVPSLTADFYTTIIRTDGGSLSTDTPVYVTYNYTDPDFYGAKLVDNFEDVKNFYGVPLNPVPPTPGQADYNPINSPLSLAAQIAFANGATNLVTVATTPPPSTATTSSAISSARRQALATAYAQVSNTYNINVIVPVTDDILDADAIASGADLKGHVESQSNSGYFRIGILGFDTALTSTPLAVVNTGGLHSARLCFAYACPQGLAYFAGQQSQTLGLGHQYLAAAYAGRLSALPVQKALTRESIAGFTGLAGAPLDANTMNSYAANGVALTYLDRSNNLIVRHGVSTIANFDLNATELSVTRASDSLVALLQVGTDQSSLIGEPLTLDTPLAVKSVVAGVLEQAVAQGSIVAYENLAVRVRSTNPSVIEVKFSYLPAYPLDYIAVTFSIDTTTGINDLTGITTTQ